ncbi:MAG: signal peptidase II [Alphaproteobacteria bacterium]|nr:signal peptidase II [Alphaproteobacteria bacterium]
MNTMPRMLGLSAALLAFVADQGSKLALLYGAGFRHMGPGESVPVLPFFNLVMVWNPGISYGLFPASGALGTWLLEAATLGVILFLGWWMWKSRDSVVVLGCGLIIGGGVGNLLDRLLYGRVADFFHFYGFGYDWYVFNIADLAVTLGAVAFIYDVLKPSESSHA